MKVILLDGGAVGVVAEGVDIELEAERLGGVVIDAADYVEPPYVPTLQELSGIEKSWRDTEMPIAQHNVTAIEYGEGDIPGTAQQWQKYWLALRKWTADNPDFPDSSKRPVAPT
ncbi:hypothetical protein PsexTeo8_40460 [Pseudomonas extremaustralis]|uniref:hypothetical protein n=1 Tax=Pseudomonas extremaustralis TaxID=359110 RepID=UPI002AA0C1D9|nr:hypothetical protein [Pseudomonas extremaustralis]MDY7067564.1 hypothetical protein [Pseudomonas extremaustralis]